jgi:hypothetical protein
VSSLWKFKRLDAASRLTSRRSHQRNSGGCDGEVGFVAGGVEAGGVVAGGFVAGGFVAGGFVAGGVVDGGVAVGFPVGSGGRGGFAGVVSVGFVPGFWRNDGGFGAEMGRPGSFFPGVERNAGGFGASMG